MVARHRTSASAAGRVRWKRLAVILVPAGAIAATLVGLTAQGAIAANVSVSGQQFLVTATQLNGTGFEQFGSEVSAGSGTKPVIVSGIGSAPLTNLCPAREGGALSL